MEIKIIKCLEDNYSYILIDKNDYVEQLMPANDQIASYYNSNKSLFLEPEKRDFIHESVESILKQTYKDFEILFNFCDF